MPSIYRLLVVFLSILGLTLALTGVGHAAQGDQRERVIVALDDGVDPHVTAHEMAARHDGRVGFVYDHVLNGFSMEVPASSVRGIERDHRVRYVEYDQVVHAYSQTVPTGVQRIFADNNGNIDIDSTDDYRVDVDVAVIDTGIDLDHPDLYVVDSIDCSGGSPFSGSCSSGGDDDNGHGTHVAGTIGAIDDGAGVVGVAPGARLHAVKVLRSDGSGYISWIVAGIEWVTERAGTIELANMSLGCECSSDSLDTAIASSVDEGVAYAVAAGNSDADASTFSPANHPDVLTVSALADFDGEAGGLGSPTCRDDEDDTLANFSNFGSTIEIAAPGVCILSTVPGGYDTYSGTSMASPHAAGALGLLASGGNDPTTQSDVKALYKTVQDTGNDDWTDDSGDGTQEPLLDVSDETVFAPALVSGSGDGSGTTDEPPSVSITNPSDGATVSGTVSVTADASDDDGVSQVEFFVDGGSIGTDSDGSDGWSASWDTTTYADGSHTVEATATDTAGQTSTSSISVTVDNSTDSTTGAHVESIGYDTWGGPDGKKHLGVTVLIHDDTDQPVSGASVSVTLKLDSDHDGVYDNGSWSGTGTTGTDGTIRFELKNAPGGCYTTDVTDIDGSGDVDEPTPSEGNEICK